jgi:DNA-binding PadR family transcriptional regulator
MDKTEDKIEKKVVTAYLEAILLNLLREGESYGYDLIKRVLDYFGVMFSPSAVYPTLYALVENGYISQTEEGNKKMYSLTEKGKKERSNKINSCYEMFTKLKLFFEDEQNEYYIKENRIESVISKGFLLLSVE